MGKKRDRPPKKQTPANGEVAGLTARHKRGWSEAEVKLIEDDRFNMLYHITDRDSTFVTYRWVGNSVVTLINTMLDQNESVVTARRRPHTQLRPTRDMLSTCGRGEDYVKWYMTSYNHWKVGVNVFDQYLTYLMCDFHCRHTWMPLMIQTLMTMRVTLISCACVHLSKSSFT